MCEGWQSRDKPCSSYPDEPPPGRQPKADRQPENDDPDEASRLPVNDEDPWDAFVPDDDHEPEPEPGDFWWQE